ncbi:MAG: alpha/beta hydrolase-fold protein [Gemmatimonadota bacterium]
MTQASRLTLLLLLGANSAAWSQATGPESSRLATLARAVLQHDPAAVERFWGAVWKEGSPIIEKIPGDQSKVLVTFLYRGDSTTKNVAIFQGPRVSTNLADNPFTLLAGTNVWYRSYAVRRDARFTYLVGANVDLSPQDPSDTRELFRRLQVFGPDRLNPKRNPTPGDPLPKRLPPFYDHSAVELPGAPPQPYVARRAGTPAGTVENLTLTSTLLKNERDVAVYTPPGYRPDAGPYDLLIVFDGEWYLTLVPTPTILDNMIAARKIPPVVAVFVNNPGTSRSAELHCSLPFADFLTTELVPWVKQRYAVTDDPARTTLAGSSAGGLASTCAALAHPERFGNVLSQSGAYWWRPMTPGEEPEWVTRKVRSSPRLPIRFYMDIGLLEDVSVLDGQTMLSVNHHLRDALREKGYDVHYAEFNGGHEYLSWQGTLSDGLIALLGARAK